MDKVEEKLSVEQGNKLIAEFMEGRYCEYHNKIFPGEFGYEFPVEILKSKWWNIKALKYHSSWDWLMPVIKKLNGNRHHSAILWEDITKALIDCDIERTWAAVVKYISWFYKK